jgi:molybdopterin converting factor small subunit
MQGEGGTPLSELKAAVRRFRAREERVDLKEFRAVIDELEGEFSAEARLAQRAGDNLIGGNITAASWISRICGMSVPAAKDRLCVGEQLESLPMVADALSRGEISYQAASVICHQREKLGEKSDYLDEEQWVGFAREHSIEDLNWIGDHMRYAVDPDGFDRDAEEDYEKRFLHISPMNGMFHLSGVLDPESGAALKTAIDGLAKRLGQDDKRSPKQRRVDAFTEIVYKAMDEGKLPQRNGVRPHITVTTTLEGLKGELGAAASELEPGMPISSKTVQRLACDGTLSRVLKADSVVIDVGRATRAISPAQRRGLKAQHRGCCGPGCDRPINWTTPHHIEFWSRGGSSDLPNLLPLCYYHHRLVHEGGWQVVKAGDEVRFIPPDRVTVRRARGPGVRWAA